MPRRSSALALAVSAALCGTASLNAQLPPLRVLPSLGSEADEMGRLRELAGADTMPVRTLRSPSRLFGRDTNFAGKALLAPELLLGYNTRFATGFNDGPLWQGRGANLRLTGGAAARFGRVRVILAPQLVAAENQPFQVIPFPESVDRPRSIWANPFHPGPASIDLPLRQGDTRHLRIDPGQSSITITGRGLEGGLATENVWWGPGMQNALLLGGHSSGVPSAFLRAAAPVRTRIGTWDGWWTVGALQESDYFDADRGNDWRTLAGAAVTWRPPAAPAVELGLARLVVAAGSPGVAAPFYPFLSVGRPNGPDSLEAGSRDQITSVWARWAHPGAGFEAWGEVARFEEPGSLRDLLEYPGHSQGYTLGLQWLRPVAGSQVRIWGEATYLEPSSSIRIRHVEATYTSRAVPQGFTHRGDAIGAAIGPGSSSQWLSGDWLHPRWRIGAFLGRVRWDNAALFTRAVPDFKKEDVSLIGGLRGAGDWKRIRVLAEWGRTVRLNYLFQSYFIDLATGRTEGIDLVNNAVTLTISSPLQLSR